VNPHRSALLVLTALAVAACSSSGSAPSGSAPTSRSSSVHAGSTAPSASPAPVTSPSTAPPGGPPHWAHAVVVVLENKASGEIVGNPDAPFLTELAGHGLQLTNSYAVTHPSEPNYLALFSGSTHAVNSDACPVQVSGPNLAAALQSSGQTFVGYSESLPRAGFTGCSSGPYARKHNPWVDFAALPVSVNQPMSAFPADLSQLPDLAFVIPNLDDDMHDGTIGQADRWLSAHLGGYASWATAHDSVLIVTTDEDDSSSGNHITTVLAGAHIHAGRYSPHIDHYGMLRTLLEAFGLPAFASAVGAEAVTGVYS
jgi:phosphatidylinositol-3-phosphatase